MGRLFSLIPFLSNRSLWCSTVLFPCELVSVFAFQAHQTSTPMCATRPEFLTRNSKYRYGTRLLVLWTGLPWEGAVGRDVQSCIIKQQIKEQYTKNKKILTREHLPYANLPYESLQGRDCSQVPLSVFRTWLSLGNPITWICLIVLSFIRISEKVIMYWH